MRSAIVVCAGGPVRRALPPFGNDPIVIAADSGVVEAQRLDLSIDRVVGDMDSAPPELVAALEADGVAVERHPADKDASDLELAIESALRQGAEELLILGGTAGGWITCSAPRSCSPPNVGSGLGSTRSSEPRSST